MSFNPRTPAGCDFVSAHPPRSADVSIHAPLRGATGSILPAASVICVSIHAPLRGATLTTTRTWCLLLRFQSTHPCGVRPIPRCHCLPRTRFNPRTPAGCDSCGRLCFLWHPVSIHAPLRGATAGCCFFFVAPIVSIHAPLRGATGCTFALASMVEFQSTHPCGVRRQFVNGMDLGLGVSIHAPLRGAT